MKKIKLTRGKYSIVDNEDFGFLNNLKWKYSSEGYAITSFYINVNKRKDMSMHRLIFNPLTELCIDHINGDKLDNRKNNLRVCSQQQNCFNRKELDGKSSKYKGVCFNKRTKRWQSRIGYNGKLIHLGMFSTPEEASIVYIKAAKKYFGKFAWKNFKSPR